MAKQSSNSTGSSPAVQDRTAATRYADAWTCLRDEDYDGFRAICADNFRLTLPGMHNADVEQAVEIAKAWHTAFSDFGQMHTALTTIESADGTQVCIRDSHRLTHSGEFRTPEGMAIPASGNEISSYSDHTLRINDRGQIVQWDIMFDRLDMLMQMGDMQQILGQMPSAQSQQSGQHSTATQQNRMGGQDWSQKDRTQQ